ncbi:MAG: hypothetical protein OEZ36_00545, partial [Spirochaetota bacterium]|nr:hypothetical protein [Spirochaetota bacterium]
HYFEFHKGAGYITPPSSPFVELEIMKDDKPVAVMGKKRIALSPNYSISTAVIPDSKYTLSLESRTEREVKAWKSHLRLLDLNNAPIEGAEKVIRVNDYLYYGGYRFYQTDAKREDPGYSGIGVSTEPGINYIYFFFTTLCAGIFLMFYIKPTRASNNDGE